MRHLTVLTVLLLGLSTPSPGQTDCSTFNKPTGPFYTDHIDSSEHIDGDHELNQTASGSCAYTGIASTSGPVGCDVTANATSHTTTWEDGSLINPLYAHYGNSKDASGITTATSGASASADSEGAVAYQSCLFSCSTAIGINGSGHGAGFAVSFSPQPLWGDSVNYLNTCAGKTLPKKPTCDFDNPPYPAPTGYSWAFDPKTCKWTLVQEHSPVIVDTTGKGFHMSDPNKNWVTFDLQGNGTFERFSWPERGSGNAWLVYDANNDGVITNGKELFGNFTPHSDGGVPNHPDPNGFLALAWYDKREQGGNMDGILDKQDAIWNHLKLWVDDHCYLTPNAPCTSIPSEVHSLESAGIHSFSLIYSVNPESTDFDAYGNRFEIYVPINVDGKNRQKSQDPRVMYDVYLRESDQ